MMIYSNKLFNMPNCIVLLFLSSIIYGHSVSAQVTQESVNAAVQQYMQALKMGDVSTANNKIGKQQLRGKNRTFKTKNYDKFLRKLYRNSQYEIINTEVTSPDTAMVDVKVIYNKSDTTKFRLWLAEDKNVLRIIEESNMIP